MVKSTEKRVSTDNGIYILYTDGENPEYRVAYAHSIDNIYGEYDDETKRYLGNPELIKETFEKSEVFHDLNEALDSAEEMSHNYEYLEDGIAVINSFKDMGHIFKKEE